MGSAEESAKKAFLDAIERYPPDQWPAYLDRVCGNDSELRCRVAVLLESHVADGGLLDGPAIAHTAVMDQHISEKPGTTIGPYKLFQQIGEGGMGAVYMAEQTEPVERRVALKIIKPGMDTRQVIARFEAEKQALAMMDHPNIAKVIDAGATDSGRPYFVMELVRGTPITTYCDQQHLTPTERLELFVPVCQAVQHAHHKGIIHRDLKPSNILVALYDGRPIPKVIDFGVAKATGARLTGETMFTQYGQVVGTLEYMSPEQANLNQLDIDTRSDIYSLGVLLYELLTGYTPFDKQRLRSAAFDEMMRIIREEEPPRPSLRLSTIDTLPAVAANRHIEPKKLSVLIHGELDWIVMKALEKDRARRYETATGFANDIQRYLNDEAVDACPPSAAYRFRKFARRNRAVIVTASLVVAALVIGIVGTTWQAIRATYAESLANQRVVAERQALDQARKSDQEAKHQLFKAYLAQAKASRWSGRPGQRLDALDAITKAVGLVESLGLSDESRLALRNEAVGAMTLVDLDLVRSLRSLQDHNRSITVSEDCRLVAVDSGPDHSIRLHSVDAPDVTLATIPCDGGEYGWISCLDPTARYLIRGQVVSTTRYLSDLSTGKDLLTFPNVLSENATDFHPQRQQLAVGEADGTVRLVEIPGGQELRSFSVGRSLHAVKFSPNGRRLAIGCMTGPLEVRELETEAVSFKHSLGAKVLAWRPDGDWLAVGSGAGIHLLDTRNRGDSHLVCRGHQSTVIATSFHPAGQVLASSAWDGTVRLWDAGSGYQLLRVPGCCIHFSADGHLLAVRQGLDLTLWKVSLPEAYRWLHKGMTRATVVAPNGRLLVSSHDDGVRLWDLHYGRQVDYWPIGPVQDLAFHPIDGSLITSGATGLRQWPFTTEVTESSVRVQLGPPREIASGLTATRMVDFSRDGQTLLVESSYDDTAIVMHMGETPPRKLRLTAPQLVNAALSPDGKWAAVSSELGMNVRIWNARSGDPVRELPTPGSARIRFSPDNHWVVTNTGPEICIWEVGSWRLRHKFPHIGDACSGIAFTSDSRLVAVGLWGVGIRLIEVETGKPIAALEAVQRPPAYSDMNFSLDGTLLVAAADREGCCVWDIEAIRRRLDNLGLDWNTPPVTRTNSPEKGLPMRVETDLGGLGKVN